MKSTSNLQLDIKIFLCLRKEGRSTMVYKGLPIFGRSIIPMKKQYHYGFNKGRRSCTKW